MIKNKKRFYTKIFIAIILLIGLYLILMGTHKIFFNKMLGNRTLFSLNISPERETINSGNLLLSADFYKQSGANKLPLIIISHGLTSRGKNFELYRLWANKLASNKLAVLIIDYRGFNESQDPDSITSYKDFNLSDDILSAVKFAQNLPDIDTSKIFLLGHSLGAGVVLDAALRDTLDRIKGVISIEADRSGRNYNFKGAADRYQREMKVNYPVPQSVAESLEYHVNLDFLKEQLRFKHPPILFIETERAERHQYFLEDYSIISQPKDFKVINNTEHYFGTIKGPNSVWGKRYRSFSKLFRWSPDIIYDKKPINDLITIIMHFVSKHSKF